ncbi:rhodanese-like domain-containing protein [Calidithermus timidus]|jgi:rhodanese-related sulfurtransferase|uniref:rhodanese-like domain-containing protein n=1 Tax=Calidithermus timidus TaxID=307124 RepID=UPI0003707C1B|nr:rhodanese-like domain-containing protein [Calidithermus timidus]
MKKMLPDDIRKQVQGLGIRHTSAGPFRGVGLKHPGIRFPSAPWLVAVLAVFVLLSSCAPKSGYKDVSVQELQAASEPNRIVLDVREPYEYAEGHVPGAILLPLGQVATQAAQLPKDAPVYVICRSGNRSAQASRTLVELGFKDVRNVQGGILAWQSAGYALER